MAAIMEKRARVIFRDALGLHYFDDISKTGAEVDGWLKTHGGWFENLQGISRDGSYQQIMPTDNGENIISKEPEKVMEDAKRVMGSLKEFLGDGVAEHIGCTALKASVKQWLADLAQGRDRSRSPRRCVIPDMTVAVLKENIQLKDQLIEALQGKIKDTNRELVENAYRISYLEATVKVKDQLIATHNSFMTGLDFSKKS